MKAVIGKPTKSEQQVAKHTSDGIEKILEKKMSVYQFSYQSGKTNEIFEFAPYVLETLKILLANMAEGKAVQISTIETELSTQEAADMLNVSRPFLIKLLEQGKIPFKKVGSHRRVELKDLEAYDQEQRAIGEKNLDFLAQQAQELNLGYNKR